MVTIFIAAFLVSAAFAPISIWYLAIIGYSLFLRRLAKSARPIAESFLFGLISSALILHWSSKYVGVLPWVLLSILQALFYLPVGWIYKRTNNIWWVFFIFLAMEELRARFPFGGFAWTRLAFSQADSPALPVVSIGGVLALTAITFLVAALFMRISVKRFALFLFIIVLVSLIPKNSQGSGEIKLLAIQGNTPSVGLDFNSRAKAVFYLHRDSTYAFTKEKFDVIVWPENAIDIDPTIYSEVAADISKITATLKSPLIAGVVQNGSSGPENASNMYGIDGTLLSSYIKRGLTPFGEYMPLRTLAEFVSPIAKRVTDFQPGRSLQTHRVAGNDIGPIICYEVIIDNLVRQMARSSTALIVQTNSATFSGTAQSRQQLSITRIRAAEYNREVLSVSTIGITAFIDNNGAVISQTLENEQSALSGKLTLNSKATFSSRAGIYAPFGILFVSFITASASLFLRRRKFLT